tara:strand:- start:78 stop:2321 length:2244 start_codon:yes stop_codon:yes gene_type:complete
MPSNLTLALARKLKTPVVVDVEDEADHQNPNMWFKCPDGSYTNYISYTNIAWHAEREYLEWRSVHDDRITHEHTLTLQLQKWVRDHSEEEIATVLDRVPPGLGADPDTGKSFDFSAWQRLSAAHWSSHLFDVTARVEITSQHLRELARYTTDEMSRARKIPIGSEMTMLKGSCPDKFICDLGTAGGKTSWSIAASLSKLIGDQFDMLKMEHRQKSMGTFVKGPPIPKVARMIVIAAAGMTFRHFVNTSQRMIPRVEAMDPTIVIHVWEKMGKQWNTTIAASLPENTIVVWVVPVERIMEVLRHDPSVTIPVVITDEFTVKTPKERSPTDQSFVMKNLITQATPQALQNATSGNRSWLKEEFGGQLHAPSFIKHLIRRRRWKDAQLAAEQLTKLDLMTLTPFRSLVRDELRDMIPIGISVTFLRSRRVTMASYLTGSACDVVPANFTNIVLAQLSSFGLTDDSRECLTNFMSASVVHPADINEVLEACTSKFPNADRSVIQRLQARLSEFQEECPICKNESMTHPNIFGCCGYCVCDECYGICNNRCPFCRTEVRDTIPRLDIVDTETREQIEEQERQLIQRTIDDKYPVKSPGDMVLSPPMMHNNNILTNLTHSIHYLTNHGHKRLLIVLERPSWGLDLSHQLDISRLSSVTGVDITRVDRMLSGKATEFAKVKRDFDSPNPQPMGLLCYGVNDTFMVGTDLASADGIIIVGNIRDSILTQAISRTLRPNALRDNTRPLPQINIYTR